MSLAPRKQCIVMIGSKTPYSFKLSVKSIVVPQTIHFQFVPISYKNGVLPPMVRSLDNFQRHLYVRGPGSWSLN